MSATFPARRRLPRFAALAVLVGLASAAALAAPTTKPSAGPKVAKPWSLMQSLSGDQRGKIAVIHKATLRKIRDLKEAENDEILALLDESQRAEYEKVMAMPKGKAAAAETDVEEVGQPATKPAKKASKMR